MHKCKVGEDQKERKEQVLLESGHSLLVSSENNGVSVIRIDSGIMLRATGNVPSLRLEQWLFAGEVGKESREGVEHTAESGRVAKCDVG